QRRRPEQQIDVTELRKSLAVIHQVEAAQLATALIRDQTFAFLDVGERALWAHTLTRSDGWVLCGPDKASLRLGVRLGLRDRLVALEALLADVGFRPQEPLKRAYTSRWLADTLAELVVSEARGSS